MPNIYIIGDSLAATKLNEKKPETGWGEVLSEVLPYPVINHAVNGRSTKSFIAENRLKPIEENIQPHDILLIQFGHNDQKIEDPLRYTKPYEDYLSNMKIMIDLALSHHAKPVLITSVSRRAFNPYHLLDGETLGEYPNAMRYLAKELKIPLIDIFQSTQALISSLGEEGSKRLFLHLKPGEHINYPDGVIDNTHLSPEGAAIVASMIALELKHLLAL
jgi:lysophospholipase L1-like esterase